VSVVGGSNDGRPLLGSAAGMRELPAVVEARRPASPALDVDRLRPVGTPAVLVVGVVLASQLNSAADTEQRLSESRHYDVEQRWVVVDDVPRAAAPRPGSVALTTQRRRPKFDFVNEQLATVDLERYEYVLLVDDDVVVPRGFLDAFLGAQSALGFVIAQPARAATSTIDHPIVARHPGVAARQTWFVEQGPVVSFHRSIVADVAPFDLRSPMGWGVECVWSELVEARGMQMGIIDAVAVDHGIRPVLANYSAVDALQEQDALLAHVAHRPIDDCMRVVRVVLDVP
jgi:hypothetical protein